MAMTHRPEGMQRGIDDRVDHRSLSMLIGEWRHLDELVERCRRAGLYRMNRSRLIRLALNQLDLAAVIESEAGRDARINAAVCGEMCPTSADIGE